jgi:RNA polymerase sigma factor (sigma-70 family)
MPPDSAELRLLLDRYERPLVRYAQSILGDVEAARDVVQETFIKWVETRGGEDAHGNAARLDAKHTEAWLFTVCRHRAIDSQRKQSRIIPMDLFDHDRTSEEPDPAASLVNRELAGSLVRLLDLLTENQREVIRLKFQNDLSYKEIAEITRLSVTNVGFLLHSGLKRLRALLSEPAQNPLEIPLRQTL